MERVAAWYHGRFVSSTGSASVTVLGVAGLELVGCPGGLLVEKASSRLMPAIIDCFNDTIPSSLV
jgi:hypothetical protein